MCMTPAEFHPQAAPATGVLYNSATHLGDDRQRCTVIQKNSSYIFVPFPSRKVQGCVA